MKKRKRIFVRPNCDKVWYFQCVVCGNKHYKFGAHPKCFRRWCELCQESFATEELMTAHAKQYHEKDFCELCNQTFKHIKNHKKNFH